MDRTTQVPMRTVNKEAKRNFRKRLPKKTTEYDKDSRPCDSVYNKCLTMKPPHVENC